MNIETDFPFSIWTTFYMAIDEFYDNFYSETYPKYASAIDDFSSNIDYDIIKKFLEKGLDAQEGLDGLIKIMMNSRHYTKDNRSNIQRMVSLLIDHGACLDIDELLKLKYEPVWNNFEDEIQDTFPRGILLEIFEKKMSTTIKPLEFIEAMYWEYIPDTTDYHIAVKMAIKHEMKEYI